jgi:ABC-type uncharacterized transport system ATPase subunit
VSEGVVLEMRGIRKVFPGVVANDEVSLDVRKGEVHALLGENGAGKSTLMNILYGLYHPDAGEIRLRGKPVAFGSARDAIHAGIGMVHQHFMLIPVMTVAENIVLGTEPREGILLDERGAERRVRELSQQFGLAVDPTSLVSDITVGQQQRVEILKALYRGADVLILDEPTAVLTPQEARELFTIIRSLQADGKSIIFISHKLNEVLEIADRITVLRRGKTIETVPAAGATEASLARAMVGRDVLLRVDKKPAQPGDVLLAVEDLHVNDDRGIAKVRGVSFEVRAGEIVGIAGVDGNGQTELIDAITGLQKVVSGRIIVGGKEIAHANARDMLDAGVGHPRGPAAPRPRPRVQHRREHCAARLRGTSGREVGMAVPAPPRCARGTTDQGIRCPWRRAAHTGGRALGRQPAEGRRRAGDRPRSAGADCSAADARPRRRRDRVPPPSAGRRAG